MRNLQTRCDPPSPTNSAGISANSGACLTPSASACARPSAPSPRPGIARSTEPGNATATASCMRRRRPVSPTVWPVEMGGWTATYPPISTSISPPWLAPPERAQGGTGGGTGPKAGCSPLRTSLADVVGGQMGAEAVDGRDDVSACRCRELAHVPAVGYGRRFVPTAKAHSSRSHRVPGRERPPFCGALVAPPPSRGVAHAPAVGVRTACHIGRRWPRRCDRPSCPTCTVHLLRHVAQIASAKPVTRTCA